MAKQDTATADTTVTDGTEPLTKEELDAFDEGAGDPWADGERVPDKGTELDEKRRREAERTDKTGDTDDFDQEAESEDESDEQATEEEAAEADKAEEDAESEEDTSEETSEEEAAADSKTDVKSDEKSTLSPEEQARHNDEMAKARIREKKARDDATKAEKEAQEATIERYLREAEDDEAELEKRKLNVEAWRVTQEKIQVNRDRLQTGVEKAYANIPLLRDASPEIEEEFAIALDDFERMYVVKDKNGRPVQVLGDVYEHLQRKAASIKRIQANGATRQDKSKSRQKSRTITAPRRAPKKAKTDEGVDAFDEEAARP